MPLRAIIYCPMHEELKEVQKTFPFEEDLTEQYGFVVYRSRMGQFEVLIASQDEMGVSTANATVRALRANFDAQLAICIGIAGSLSDDASLGDVCFSQEVIDINENQKVENGETAYQPKTYGSNKLIDKQIGMAAVHHALAEQYSQWQEECAERFRGLVRNLPSEILVDLRAEPTSKRGPIVCGPVVADKSLKRRLKAINRKVLAVETETSGIYQSLSKDDKIEVLAIRGISDLADDSKKSTEVAGKQVFRQIAASNAATFLAMQLKHNFLLANALAEDTLPLLTPLTNIVDPVESLIQDQLVEIEQSLTELSPDNRARGRGYILPVPRVKLAMKAGQPSEQIEPLQLVSTSMSAVIDVPISYPDKGLPWLYAKQLLGTIANDKIVVPIVISGRDIKPPKNGVLSIIEKRAPTTLTLQEILPVAILIDLPFGNERKTSQILEEVQSKGLNAIVFGDGSQKSFFASTGRFVNWQAYSLCDVSLSSIVSFLSAQFSMEQLEAEVIAVRLSATFRSFNLSAHPTYFAGIPKEMLARLSDANHRAELIDLAVTGFLSFIGAGDTQEVSLKQRTRRIFLRDLAYRLVVQKENITIEELISYVKAYSSKHDFGLPAMEFVQSFISNGILHESGNYIQFSIAFIENYLVAERLATETQEARRYFDPNLNEIDFSTFELYAEIGLSPHVLEDVLARLEKAIDTFGQRIGESAYLQYRTRPASGSYRSTGHPFTDGSIKPKMLNNISQIADFQDKVEKAAKDLVGTASNVEGKQKVLDLSENARRGASQRKAQANGNGASHRAEIGRDWLMAIVLLGSAAKNLRRRPNANLRLRSFIWRPSCATIGFGSLLNMTSERSRTICFRKPYRWPRMTGKLPM